MYSTAWVQAAETMCASAANLCTTKLVMWTQNRVFSIRDCFAQFVRRLNTVSTHALSRSVTPLVAHFSPVSTSPITKTTYIKEFIWKSM